MPERFEGTEQPRIVAGVDGSADGLRAVEYAARTVLVLSGRLHLVHAVDDAVMAGAWGVVQDAAAMEQVGREAIAEARRRALDLGVPETDITEEVILGHSTSVLTRASEGATRLVVGRRRLRGLERMFVGSTSAGLAALAHCPLVVISSAINPGQTGGYGVIAVGVDSDGRSDATLQAAYAEARTRGVRLLVTHIQPPVPVVMFGGYQLTDEAERALLTAAREEISNMITRVVGGCDQVPIEVLVGAGDPVERLIQLSRDVDLLVLGMRAPTRLGFALGGVTRAVLAHAESPLMVIR